MSTFVRSVLAALSLLSMPFAQGQSGVGSAPTSAYEVCESILSASKKIQCLEAIGGFETDRNAAGVCAQMLGDQNKFECIKAIAGKVYDPMAVRVCQNVLGDTARINCLDRGGRVPPDRDRDCVDRHSIVRALREIKSLLEDWQVRDAIRAVENLEDRVRDCRR